MLMVVMVVMMPVAVVVAMLVVVVVIMVVMVMAVFRLHLVDNRLLAVAASAVGAHTRLLALFPWIGG
jgi:hypothetical protein